MDDRPSTYSRIQTVFGSPVDSVSLVTSATCWPRWQKAVVAFGIIALRRREDVIKYKSKHATAKKHVDDLPKDVVELILSFYWHRLYNDEKQGYEHYNHSILCQGCRRVGYDMLEEVFTGEDCDECTMTIMGWFEEQGRDKRVRTFLADNGYVWAHKPPLDMMTYVRHGLSPSVIALPSHLEPLGWTESTVDADGTVKVPVKDEEAAFNARVGLPSMFSIFSDAFEKMQTSEEGPRMANFLRRFTVKVKDSEQAFKVVAGVKRKEVKEDSEARWKRRDEKIEPSWITLATTHGAAFDDD